MVGSTFDEETAEAHRAMEDPMNSLMEYQIESAVHDAIGDKAIQLMRGVSKLASKQGGETAVENYQLLGKRALIVAGVAIVSVQVVTGIFNLVVSRKREQKRIEETVRRVLAEERAREEEAKAK